MLTRQQIASGYQVLFGTLREAPTELEYLYWEAQSADGSVSSADFLQKLAAYTLNHSSGSELEAAAKSHLYTAKYEDVLRPVANWTGPVTERIQFNTDVLTARYGAEQRLRLLRFPRVSLEYAILLTTLHLQHYQNQLQIMQGRPVYIPLWQEELVAPKSTLGEWELNSIEGLTTGIYTLYLSYDKAEVVEIVENNGNLFFKTTPSMSQSAVPRIIPVVLGDISGSQILGFITANVASGRVQANLNTYDPDKKVNILKLRKNTIPLQQSLKHPVLFLEQNWITPAQHGIDRETHVVDFNTGVKSIYDLRGYSDTKQTLEFFGKKNKYGIRDFFLDCAGRFADFYFPTFLEDIVLPENFSYVQGGFKLKCKHVGIDFYQNGKHKMLWIEFKGKPAVACKITESRFEDSMDVLVIANPVNKLLDPFGFNWVASDIKRISYLNKCRFDSDSLEVSWINREYYKVTTTIRTIQ